MEADELQTDLPYLPHRRPEATTCGTERFYVDISRSQALTIGVRWLSVESTARRLDAVLLVSKLPRAADLSVALGDASALALVGGQIVRFNRQYLQLLEIKNVHREARRHHVALALQLSDDELLAADWMNAAALCLVPDPTRLPVQWLSRWQPVWIGRPREERLPAPRGAEESLVLASAASAPNGGMPW